METTRRGHWIDVKSRKVTYAVGFLPAIVALAWGCGGTLASSPDGGGGDASTSSSGSSGGVASSSGIPSSGGSTSGSGGSGSSSTSGSSASSSSGGSSSGSSCSLGCSSDTQCQQLCPPVANGTLCCDQASGACYATTNNICPLPLDAGCPTTQAICPVLDSGDFPLNPNTGSPGCDGCIECSCGSPWCTCSADSAVDNSGNVTGCLAFVECFITCLTGNADAGIAPAMDASVQGCGQTCSLSHSMQQVQEGEALLSCMVQSCATPTTCGG